MIEKITDTNFANSPFLFPFCNSGNHTNGDSVNYGQVEAHDNRELNFTKCNLALQERFLIELTCGPSNVLWYLLAYEPFLH